jgi:2-polyprenyl-3-methyl-5-hydroxy-6-metoxy-1,4-benzoquinol methylase
MSKYSARSHYYLKSLLRGGVANFDKLRAKVGDREIATFLYLYSYSFNRQLILPEQLQQANFELARDASTISNVLDLGAGDMFLKESIEKLGISYTSLDLPECNFETDAFPLPSNQYDCVFSLAVLEHLRDPSNFLLEIRRVLKSGGVLWLSTPNWHYCSDTFYDDYTHVSPYTPKSLHTLLKDFGFDDTHIYPNLRCKPITSYIGYAPFFRAKWLRPFKGSSNFLVPEFLKGKAVGIFSLSINPERLA